MYPAQQELRNLIRSKLTDDMSADQAADAVMRVLYDVADDWESIDISTVQDGAGNRYLDQRKLVVKVHTSDVRERSTVPDRTVSP